MMNKNMERLKSQCQPLKQTRIFSCSILNKTLNGGQSKQIGCLPHSEPHKFSGQHRKSGDMTPGRGETSPSPHSPEIHRWQPDTKRLSAPANMAAGAHSSQRRLQDPKVQKCYHRWVLTPSRVCQSEIREMGATTSWGGGALGTAALYKLEFPS